MICFDVSVNGNRLCTAGVGEYGVLTAVLSWVRSQPEETFSPEDEQREQSPDLHIGGLVNGEHVRWIDEPFFINVGDEVSLRVVDSDNVDAPGDRQRASDPETARSNRDFLYQQYQREFEGIGDGKEPPALRSENARQLRRALYEEYRAEFENDPARS